MEFIEPTLGVNLLLHKTPLKVWLGFLPHGFTLGYI